MDTASYMAPDKKIWIHHLLKCSLCESHWPDSHCSGSSVHLEAPVLYWSDILPSSSLRLVYGVAEITESVKNNARLPFRLQS